MDSRAIKVFLACALGAGVGSLITLHAHPYFWWVGLLAGGVIGYVSYDFKQVLRAIPAAVSAARQAAEFSLDHAILSSVFWNTVAKMSLCILAAIALATTLTTIGLFFDNMPFMGDITISSYTEDMLLIGIVCAMFFWLILSVATFQPSQHSGIKFRFNKRLLGAITVALIPPMPALLLVGSVLYGTIWIITKTIVHRYQIRTFCVVFAKTLFLTIHSDIRLLCGVDATIGTIIGFFVVNPFIGALVGGLIGVVNYKVVSQKWLRLHLREQNG